MQECPPRRADATCQDLPHLELRRHQSKAGRGRRKEGKRESPLRRVSQENQVLVCRPARYLVAILGKGLPLWLGQYLQDFQGYLAQSPSERARQSTQVRSGHPHTRPQL